jgi:hypothetical protein
MKAGILAGYIKPKRAICPKCGRKLTLNNRGQFKGHLMTAVKRGTNTPFDPCSGSYTTPNLGI